MRHSLLPAALRYLDQVARSGSIQAAAKELHVAASAMHRQILQLETEIGVPLFERLPRGMRLTPSGDTLVALARRWRSDERRAIADVRQLQGVFQGQVRLVAMDSHATSFLPGLVEQLAAAHPLIALSVEIGSTDDAMTLLLHGRADLIAAFNLPPRRDLHLLWQTELPFGCVVSPGHPLSGADSVSLQEATAYPVALQSRSLQIRRYLEAHYSWLFAETRGRFETNSLQLLKQLVRSGRYVAITSELDVAPELLDGSLAFVPVRDQGAEPQTIAVAIDATRPLSPIVKRVGEQLVEAVSGCLDAVRRSRPASA